MNEKCIYEGVKRVLLSFTNIKKLQVLRSVQKNIIDRFDNPIIYMTILSTVRCGYPSIKTIYQEQTDDFITFESVPIETTMQLSCFLEDMSSNESGLSANDLAQQATMALQGDRGREMLQGFGIRPLRISIIHNNYFQNDREQNETNSKFDIVLISQHTISYSAQVADKVEGKIQNGNFN